MNGCSLLPQWDLLFREACVIIRDVNNCTSYLIQAHLENDSLLAENRLLFCLKSRSDSFYAFSQKTVIRSNAVLSWNLSAVSVPAFEVTWEFGNPKTQNHVVKRKTRVHMSHIFNEDFISTETLIILNYLALISGKGTTQLRPTFAWQFVSAEAHGNVQT